MSNYYIGEYQNTTTSYRLFFSESESPITIKGETMMLRYVLSCVFCIAIANNTYAEMILTFFDEGGNLAMTLTGSGTSTGGVRASFDFQTDTLDLFDNTLARLTFNTFSSPFGAFGVLRNNTTGQEQTLSSIGILGPDVQDPDADRIRQNLLTMHEFNPGDSWSVVGGGPIITETPFEGIFNNGVYPTSTSGLGLGQASIVVIPEPQTIGIIASGLGFLAMRRQSRSSCFS